MRRRGSGTIARVPTGHRVQVWVDGRRRSLGVYPTREEAEALLEGALVELAQAEHHDGVTLRAWGERALDRRELQGLRAVARERSRWAVHVLPDPIADLPVRSIVRADVQRWLDRRVVARGRGARGGSTIARQTAGNALVLLRAVLEDALARGVATTNPARDVRLPRSRGRTVEPWTYLLPEEQARVLSRVPTAVRPTVAFAIRTGLRQGEQWALRLEDVHLEEPAPHVTVRFGAPGKATKSGRPRRVDLLPEAVAAVRDQLAQLRGRPNPHGVLFPTLRGTRRQRGAPTGWETWIAEAELGRPVRWHDLRHTCASSLVAGWWGRAWTLLEVRALLGHSTVAITERYAHLAGTVTEEAVRATRESNARAHAEETEARKYWSRLRDLNSRPTVYEGVRVPSDVGEVDLARARASALDAVEAIADGGGHAWRRALDALAVVLDALDEVPMRRGAGAGR